MDSREHNNLAFIIKSLAANPSKKTFSIAEDRIPFSGSTEYNVAINVLREVANKLDEKAPSQQLMAYAQQLSDSQDLISQTVGKTLLWAIESIENRR